MIKNNARSSTNKIIKHDFKRHFYLKTMQKLHTPPKKKPIMVIKGNLVENWPFFFLQITHYKRNGNT